MASDSVKCNFPGMIILCGGSPKSILSRLLNFPEIIFCVSNPILDAIIANVSSLRMDFFCSFSISSKFDIAFFGSRKYFLS